MNLVLIERVAGELSAVSQQIVAAGLLHLHTSQRTGLPDYFNLFVQIVILLAH